MIIDPPPGERPPTIPIVLYWLASVVCWVAGWKIVKGPPNLDKMVIAAAPHTSNWDGFWYLFLTLKMRLRTHVLMKSEMVGTPAGWIFRLFGGIPVDRSASQNAVRQVVREFQQRDKLALVIAPEGTRKYTDHWRPGFYWIAHTADVPIAVVYLNYKEKHLGFAGVIKTTGDIQADMNVIAQLLEGRTHGRFPAFAAPVRVRSRTPEATE